MRDDSISVLDLADQIGRRKTTLFKVIKRLRIETFKRRDSARGNQLVVHIAPEDALRVRQELDTNRAGDIEDGQSDSSDDEYGLPADVGVFYLLALEPEFDPSRFKVGFAASMPQRLRALRCSAPFSEIVKTWPCKRLWERTAIDCVTENCEQLHTEVFRCNSLDEVVRRCDSFFAIMPNLDVTTKENTCLPPSPE